MAAPQTGLTPRVAGGITPLQTATFAGVADALGVQRIDRQGNQRARVGAGSAQAAYSDATEVTESWANLSGVNAVANAQVSGNRFYSVSATNPGGFTKAWSIPVGQRFHFQTLLYWKAGGSAPVYLGLDVGASGHALVGGEPTAMNIGLSGAGARNNVIGSTLTTANIGAEKVYKVGTDPTVDTTYVVTIDADDNYITFTLRKQGVTSDYSTFAIDRAKLVTAGLTVQNITVYLTDARGSAGHGISPFVAVSSLQPARTKALGGQTIEGANHRLRLTSQPNALDAWMYALPKTYDPRKPAPVVMFLHQSLTGNARNPWDESRLSPVTAALLDAGYIVAAADAYGDKYGNSQSIAAHLDLYNHLRDAYATGPLFLFGASMGGLEMFNILGQRKWPTPAAVAGVGMALSLQSVLDAGEPYATNVRNAYGAAADGSDFAAKTAGYDPGKRAGWEFRGVPVRLYTSTGDTVQPKAKQDTFSTVVQPYAAETSVVLGTGGHLDASQYQAANVLAFFDAYRA